MSSEEIIKFWGDDNLIRWSESDLRSAGIPRSSKAFLIDVGLPRDVDWTLRFDRKANQLPLLQRKSDCFPIGFDDRIPICLEEGSGSVIADETQIGARKRFVNSNADLFGQFLVLYQQYRKAARVESENDVLKTIENVEDEMRKTDPPALKDPNNYWPAIIEQMKQGLL